MSESDTNKTGDNSEQKEIGRRLRFYRTTKGLTQAEVAAYLGISFQQVQKYENGKNQVSTAVIKRLCQLYNISLDKLLGSDESIMDNDTHVLTVELYKRFHLLSTEKKHAIIHLIRVMTEIE